MLERLKKRFKQQKGFTLVELLAVLAILGVILAIAVPSVSGVIGKSKEDADKSNRELMENAARLAHASGVDPEDGAYTLDNLVKEGFLEEKPTNPNTDKDYNGTVEVTNEADDSDVDDYTFEYKPGEDEEEISDDTSGGNDDDDDNNEEDDD
ncbi:type II secretion system protein [Lentibacillus cibarius]|uniref:Type II secretion system protein n=1 Tax=Lentibacillus cibarius TaxID=2583219 RepID=A0A549YF58_9BACI|nr:type II secretion system protein [Lentibacillus cibarius]TMN21585.1 type II secretion system protein [Lentibacillus cibarius]TRM10488.1 type II secretion system protein [Lentibacillus cibarius]